MKNESDAGLKMIKHIIFDLGNVIVTVHPERAMESFAKQSRISQSKIRHFYLSDLHLDFMRGRYSPDEFYQKMSAQYEFRLSMDDFFSIWNQVIGEPKEGIVQIIDQLASGFILSICSNTDASHWNYCQRRYSFLQRFQNYFLSFEMKVYKPNLEIFEMLLSELKAAGEECVFIDDTLANIEAARLFSIRGIHAEEPAKILEELQRLELL